MLIYCSHEYGGKVENFERVEKIVHDLQIKDPENTYISPLHAFSFLKYGDLGFEEEMELCLDLLTVCDELLVCSKISEGVSMEIDLAIKCKMPVRYL